MTQPARARGFLFIVGGVEAMGAGAVFTLLAELQDAYDLPTWGLGFIAGVTFATSVVAQLVAPRYADRGRTRLMLRLGVILAAIGMAWFGLASTLWQFVAARAVLGLGWGTYMPTAGRALVSDKPEGAGESLGRLASVQVAGFVLGPPVAALIHNLAGLRAPFLLQAGAMVLCLPLLSAVQEPSLEEDVERRPLRALVRRRGVRAALAAGAAMYLSFGTFEAIWARFMTDLGASTNVIALSLSLFPLPLIVIAPYGGRLADRIGPIRAAVLALWATVFLQVGFGLLDWLWAVIALSVVEAIVGAVSLPGGQAAAVRAAPKELIAASQGLYGATGAAWAAVGSVAAAALYDSVGRFAMWMCFAGATGLLATIAYIWDRKASFAETRGEPSVVVQPPLGP